MNSGIRLIIAVVLLCAIGIGVAVYKNQRLGVPLWHGERSNSWLIEAKVSFIAVENSDAVARLALPEASDAEGVSQQPGSLGFQYSPQVREDGPVAAWSAREVPEGSHALYYRLRLPEDFRFKAKAIPVEGAQPKVSEPGLPGTVGRAAEQVIAKAYESSGDKETFFYQLIELVSSNQPSQEIILIRRYYETEERVEDQELLVMMSLHLLQKAGIPARRAYGVLLDPDAGPQTAIPLIEYCDGENWIVKNPAIPNQNLTRDGIFVWARGGGALLEVFGGTNSKVVFTVIRDEISLEKLAQMRASPFLTSTILGLPVSERAVFSYVVLIPLGAFVVVLMRNLVGISTLGTFMPVLLALAFLEMPVTSGVVMFGVIVSIGLYFRFLLSSMNLLVVPRVAACVVIVTLLMLILSLVSFKLGIRGMMQITLFPMIIIAWTIERMSIIWEEEGKHNAIVQVSGSVFVAIVAFSVMKIPQIQYWAQYFPELLLVLLGAILLLGRYTGYRLSELVRFRNFSES